MVITAIGKNKAEKIRQTKKDDDYYCYYYYLETKCHSRCPSWSAMARSELTTTSDSGVEVILLPQPPK